MNTIHYNYSKGRVGFTHFYVEISHASLLNHFLHLTMIILGQNKKVKSAMPLHTELISGLVQLLVAAPPTQRHQFPHGRYFCGRPSPDCSPTHSHQEKGREGGDLIGLDQVPTAIANS